MLCQGSECWKSSTDAALEGIKYGEVTLFCTCTYMVNFLQFQTLVACSAGQTEQTQIRQLLKKLSDQGLPCLLFWQAFCEFQPWKPTFYLRTEREKRSNIFRTFTGLQIRVCTRKLFILFLNQNICCGYSKEPSQWDGSFEHPKHMFKLMGKKIITILC